MSSPPSPPTPPVARVDVPSGAGWARLLPVLALLLALFLLREAWSERGPLVVVRAADGHGLAAGDPLRFRGIDVGEVETVELSDDASQVRIEVRLARSAADLARAGTRFWIARPVLGVEGVRDLETALGSRFLAVLPGPVDSPAQRDFLALDEPPLAAAEDAGALEVVLLADRRAGLARGAPVTYRGIRIGAIVSVALARDATAVELRARIEERHAELVREDSRFHRAPAAGFSLGLGGLEVTLPSLQALWLGGVGLATPTHPGARARTGQRFALFDAAEEEWLAWRPALAVGVAEGAGDGPERVWGRLTWEPEGWFRGTRSRGAWLVRLPDGLLGPADVLGLPVDAEEGSAWLELEGERVPLTDAAPWSGAGLARRDLPGGAAAAPGTRPLGPPEDVLLLADPALAPVAVSVEHLAAGDEGWDVSPVLPLDERWHGAAATARGDGAWLGVLLVEDGTARIAPLPPF